MLFQAASSASSSTSASASASASSPSELKDYNGGRTFDDLKKFAEENLGPSCGPANLDLCDDAVKVKIETFMKMSAGKLEGKARNALKMMKEDVPLMKKVLAKKAGGEAKSEL